METVVSGRAMPLKKPLTFKTAARRTTKTRQVNRELEHLKGERGDSKCSRWKCADWLRPHGARSYSSFCTFYSWRGHLPLLLKTWSRYTAILLCTVSESGFAPLEDKRTQNQNDVDLLDVYHRMSIIVPSQCPEGSPQRLRCPLRVKDNTINTKIPVL